MLKIATHDSVTGEQGYGLSKIFTLFAKTQTKTISEQLNIGVRYFDIRVRKTSRGWIGAHGFWTSKKLIDDILFEINEVGKNEDIYVNITYEGFGTPDFNNQIKYWINKYSNIKFVYISIKYGKKFQWTILDTLNEVIGGAKDKFMKLDFKSWHTLIPIPFLWKIIKKEEILFNNEYYQFVDFI